MGATFFKQHKRIWHLLIGLLSLTVLTAPLLLFAAGTPGVTDATKPPPKLDMSFFGSLIGNLILWIAARVTWLGGLMLDTAVFQLVIQMGAQIRGGQLEAVINDTWIVVRDLSNLMFIFGFVYIGIRTIYDYESSTTKRMLGQIVIAALLINFSLFFTKIVIDASNLLATEIYASLISRSFPGDPSMHGIAEAVAGQMGIVGLYNLDSGATVFANLTASGNIAYYIIGAVFLIIAGFVFAAGGILIIIRFVVLIFIMIFSPILFSAMVFPKTQQYASQLWKYLISYSFFAPAYLFMVYISLQIMQGSRVAIVGNNTGGLGDAIATSNGIGGFGVILHFTIVIIFMVLSLIIAKQMGIAGAGQAIKIGTDVRRGAQGFVGRNVLGRPTSGLAKYYEKNRDSSSKARNRLAGLMTLTGVRSVAQAGAKGKYGGSLSRQDVIKADEERDRKRERDRRVVDVSKSVTLGAQVTADDADKIKMEQNIIGASNEQLLALVKKHKEGSPEYETLLRNMSQSQFETLMKEKEENLDDTKKSKLSAVRADQVEKRILERENEKRARNNQPLITSIGDENLITRSSVDDLKALGFDKMLDNANKLNRKQIDDLKLTTTQMARLGDAREKMLLDEFNTTDGAKAIFDRFNDTEKARLPKQILVSNLAAPHINVNVLNKIIDNDSISQEDRRDIRKHAIAHHGEDSPVGKFFTNTPNGLRYG